MTSAPTDPVCDTQTGATCRLFADTTGGTLTKPAANSHACGEATASMATTVEEAPVVPVVELPAYDPPATQVPGQHTAALARPHVPAAQGGSVSTDAPHHDLAQPEPSTNHDLLPNTSGDSTEEIETDQHSPHDIQRSGSHHCCSIRGHFRGHGQRWTSVRAIHAHHALMPPAHLCSTHLPAASSAAPRKLQCALHSLSSDMAFH
ncbi:hypothetical protein MTO96_039927 [Rhipicephalus appendiculatus]